MLDGCEDRACRIGQRFAISEVWIQHVQLPHLAIGPPLQIAIAGVLQIRVCNLVEAKRQIETRGEFAGHSFIVDKSVRVCRADSLLVKTHGIEVAAFYSCNLRADQCSTVFKILWAIRRPYFELPSVSG